MKKLVLTGFMLAFGVSFSLAMSDSKPVESPAQKQHADHPHKLVDIYIKDDQNSKIFGQITLKNQDNYNIFYCKQNNWCEVVDKNNGNTGWISLDKLKQAQEKFAKYIHKQNTIKRLEEYTKIQDQKIAQLHAMMMQMHQEFAYALEQQQAQINQLKQTYYYQ
ncbi:MULTISPECIES: hypothetical protein [Francisella]|uniref:SH3 domain-containing protein n=1 Tax=Francisella opportunistica TaxID=2016517 RepID=A0A345JRZ2_9GAMM|nr:MULTISPECIES: hypothetical protein [Francisella]APC91846.1 hypothetical protein BBG19_1112 [Francisella sp. MA067296]AXH30088.1 hypothetical protein CGC43_05580 [Francisella opportunistica]AXH31732.1 hypothetical protein CGC44_05570 [Francisella opportunistica]AXH33378.1 hypothetical protein CGC45_05580 [Francisella opportunistica]